jgi:putative transposase
MANTYSQMYVQIVFVVKGRQNLISSEHRVDLEKFICGIIKNRGQIMLAVYCMPNHTHVLIAFKPTIAISDLARDVKAGSSKFINDSHWLRCRFNWQEGFGAFTYSKRQVETVVNYIKNQEDHHKKKSFKEEYYEFLKEYEIEFDEKYLFDWVE